MRRFLRLNAADRTLLVQCAGALAAMRIGLWILSLRTLHALVARAGHRRALLGAGRHSAERIAWAIRVAARYVPGATGLPQALAAQFMLARHGHAARLRLGVAMTEERQVEGHAWVEGDAGVVIGGGNVARYTPLSTPGVAKVDR